MEAESPLGAQTDTDGQLRASDAERDRAVEILAGAVGEGRLTLEEYSARSGSALSARTQSELAALTSDLPAAPGGTGSGLAGPSEDITAILGNQTRKGPWVVPARLSVRTVLGDCHLEMQHAVLRQPVTTVRARVLLGSVTIYVPDGIEVRMSGKAVLGSKSSELRGAPRPGAPVLDVHCDVLLGSVTVRRPEPGMS